jgi:hypothetical protein
MSTIITVVSFGRDATPAETDTMSQKLDECVSAGTTNGTGARNIDHSAGVRIWTTEAAADEWIALLNTFTPPPAQALVQII